MPLPPTVPSSKRTFLKGSHKCCRTTFLNDFQSELPLSKTGCLIANSVYLHQGRMANNELALRAGRRGQV